jgi:hypothetical protein
MLGMGGLQNQRYGIDENNATSRMNIGSNYDLGLRGIDLNQQGIDNSLLFNLLGAQYQNAGFNNAASGQEAGILASLFGMVPQGGMGGDPASAFGVATNAALGNAQNQQNASNQFWGGLGSLGSAFLLSDRNVKTDIEPVDNDATLESLRNVPVSRWKYIGDDQDHIGPMAQDFGAEMNGNPEATTISVIDAIGSLISSVQALADRVERLETA